MQSIIDVEYREVTALEEMSTEELATEANSLWEQSEMVAAISLNLLAKAGERLQIIKGRLPHGQWEDWCADNLKFSKSKAEKVMLFASKVRDKTSVFAKTETFTDIGISKVYALLSTSEDVAKTMIENPESRDMSVREFKDEIKRLKEAAEIHQQKEVEDAGRIEELDTQLQAAMEHAAELEALLKEASEKPDNEEELAKIKAKLQKAEEKLAKEKEARKKDKEKAEESLASVSAEAEERAREKVEAQNQNKMEMLQLQYEDAMKEVDKLSKKLANNQQEDMAVFKVNASRLQEDFNACMASIEKVAAEDPEQAGKMKGALGQVMNVMMGRV
ncbi:MAG: DUF3102 domain-containing protein [Firmicutes bacterium]|nr:DUF3102 domain-containing protein [Bacillota bacterium]